jgi:hypothetical protein
MTAFFVGFIMGMAFAACGFVLFFTRKSGSGVPDIWTEEYHQKPEVVTHVTHKSINRKRSIEL